MHPLTPGLPPRPCPPGARNSSIWKFVQGYPHGAQFEVIAFEADPKWAPRYTAASCASWNVSINCDTFQFQPAAVGVNDTISYFASSGDSIGRRAMSRPDSKHSVPVQTVGFGRSLASFFCEGRSPVRHKTQSEHVHLTCSIPNQ